MRISDWSSDVCSSDLPTRSPLPCIAQPLGPPLYIRAQAPLLDDAGVVLAHHRYWLIGPPLPHGLMLGTAFHRRRARPHMHGRLLLDSAPLVAAMVHPLRDVRPFQRRILHLGPPATPALDLPARLLVQFAGLRAHLARPPPGFATSGPTRAGTATRRAGP